MKVIRRRRSRTEVRRLDVANADSRPPAPRQRGWDPLTLRSEVEGEFRAFGARIVRDEGGST